LEMRSRDMNEKLTVTEEYRLALANGVREWHRRKLQELAATRKDRKKQGFEGEPKEFAPITFEMLAKDIEGGVL
jgi:hypothetical protein